MRVALVSHTARLSGAEIATLDLAATLRRATEVEAELVLFEEGPLVARAEAAGVPVTVVPLGRGAADLRRHAALRNPLPAGAAVVSCARWLAETIEARSLDLVHTNSLKAHVVGGLGAALARRPCLWHLRDFVAPPHVSRAEAGFLRAGSRLARAVVAVSTSCAEVFGRRVEAVLPSGVQTDRFAAVPDLAAAPNGTATIASIGRISPWKGQHVLVAAARSLERAGVDVRLLFAGAAQFGEDEYAAELRRGAEGLECEFLGHVDDLTDVLRRADVIAHTSIWPEPFGKVIVEAMAAGRPVVATDAGGPRDILTGELRACLVPPGDADELAARLAAIVGDRERARLLVAHGRARARDFDVLPVARRTAALYEALC